MQVRYWYYTLAENNLIFKNFRVCQLSYKFILRYENLEDDWQQFLEDAGIKEDLDLAWINRSGGGDYMDYYKDLTDLDIIKLYEKFESDFLMFGYTLEGYLHKKSFWSQTVKVHFSSISTFQHHHFLPGQGQAEVRPGGGHQAGRQSGRGDGGDQLGE